MAVLGVLKPRPTSLYHLLPPLPTRLFLDLETRLMCGCFWKARSLWTVSSVAMVAAAGCLVEGPGGEQGRRCRKKVVSFRVVYSNSADVGGSARPFAYAMTKRVGRWRGWPDGEAAKHAGTTKRRQATTDRNTTANRTITPTLKVALWTTAAHPTLQLQPCPRSTTRRILRMASLWPPPPNRPRCRRRSPAAARRAARASVPVASMCP